MGILPGFGMQLNHSYSNIEIGINAERYASLVNYDGHTQAGDPHTTQTDTIIAELGLTARLHLVPQRHLLTVGYSADRWQRDILPNNGVLGLYELYQWSTSKVGYEYRQQSGPHHFQLGIERLWQSNSRMQIDFIGISPSTIPLKNASGWQGHLHYFFEVNPKLRLSTQFQLQSWSSDKSDRVTIDSQFGPISIHEPRSETLNRNINLSMSYIF